MSLRIEQDGRLCRITLAAPDKRNLLDAAACRDLLRELRAAEADSGTGAILLEADGQVFSAGAEPEDDELFSIGRNIAKPIVAAVQGVAVSGGLALVANAHVVVAAQGTSFGLTDIREATCTRRSFARWRARSASAGRSSWASRAASSRRRRRWRGVWFTTWRPPSNWTTALPSSPRRWLPRVRKRFARRWTAVALAPAGRFGKFVGMTLASVPADDAL